MVMFVHQLVDFAAEWCSEQILQQLKLLESRAAEEQEESPMDTLGLIASQRGSSALNPRIQEEPHEELGQVVAAPSAAGQGRNLSPGGPGAH